MARSTTQGTPLRAAIWLTAAPSISTQSGWHFSAMAALVAQSPTKVSPVAMRPAMAFTPQALQACSAACTSAGSPWYSVRNGALWASMSSSASW